MGGKKTEIKALPECRNYTNLKRGQFSLPKWGEM